MLTNSAKYGDTNSQDSTVTAGTVISFQDIDLQDLYFINAGAGANTQINAVCIAMTEGRKKELGVA